MLISSLKDSIEEICNILRLEISDYKYIQYSVSTTWLAGPCSSSVKIPFPTFPHNISPLEPKLQKE